MISIASEQSQSLPDQFYDIILISGDYYADHPHSGIGLIAKVLENAGYSIGIIEKPDWTKIQSFLKLGLPRLFFGVTSGIVDSMLQNYTPLKHPRKEDPYSPYDSRIPDRAVIVYSQKIRQAEKWARSHWDSARINQISPSHIPIVLGGVEASLRRFTHYDYWDNKLRRPILLDAKADLLVYGPGEFQIIEIAHRIDEKENLEGIEGTMLISSNPPETSEGKKFIELPDFKEVSESKEAFCRMHLAFSNQKNLYQRIDTRFVVQFRMHNYTQTELDQVYDLPFTYNIPEKYSALKMAQFSVITHRGCFGNCNFCSIRLHQGEKIVSRSPENILREIKKMQQHPKFKGNIGDLGGPSANMYGMDCDLREECTNDCITCPNLHRSHSPSVKLLQAARKLKGIKKIFVRSGVRYDLAIDEDEYLIELSKYHISGHLKIAPEHFVPHVYELMNKDNTRFDEFKQKFDQINKPLRQSLKYYFITAHPGSTTEDAYKLREKLQTLGFHNTESIQIFTPTPMSISTCMYYTGLNPYTMKPIYVPYTYQEKKTQKRVLYPKSSNRRQTKKKRSSKTIRI